MSTMSVHAHSSFDIKKWIENVEKYIDDDDKEKVADLLETFHLYKKHGHFRNKIFQEDVIKKNKKVIAYLIDNGYDVNVKDKLGYLPIGFIICKNNIEVVKLLLQKGAICSYSNKALYFAMLTMDINMVKLFLEHGCDVNYYSKYESSPLIKAMKTYTGAYTGLKEYIPKLTEIIQIFIDAGANVNSLQPILPLCYATCLVDLTKLMLNNGALVDAVDGDKRTALFHATQNNNLSSAKLLIEAGCNIDHSDRFGNTSLHIAAKNLNLETAMFLLNCGASVKILNNKGQNVLNYCLRSRISECLCSCFVNKFGDADEIIDNQNPKKVDEALKCMKLLINNGASMKKTLSTVLSNPGKVVHSKILNFLLLNGVTFESSENLVRSIIERRLNLRTKIPYILIKYSVLFCTRDSNKQLPFKQINLRKELCNYYVQCKNELELVKEANVGDRMPLFSVLSNKNIGGYARNELICNSFQDYCVSKRFPVYGDLLIKRFKREKRKQKRLKKAANGLCNVLSCSTASFPNIIDNVLKYLSKKDLIKLDLLKKI